MRKSFATGVFVQVRTASTISTSVRAIRVVMAPGAETALTSSPACVNPAIQVTRYPHSSHSIPQGLLNGTVSVRLTVPPIDSCSSVLRVCCTAPRRQPIADIDCPVIRPSQADAAVCCCGPGTQEMSIEHRLVCRNSPTLIYLHLHLVPPSGMTPVKFRRDFRRQKTRLPVFMVAGWKAVL